MKTLRDADVVRSERLDLVLMPPPLLEALIAGDRGVTADLAGYHIPAEFPSEDQAAFLRFRLDQLESDASRAPWLVRAIVRRDDGRMIGFVNFHGPPGVNDTMTPEAAELGWTIFPEHRRRGYATETARALMTWARGRHGVTHFISSTTPENLASLRVHEKLGFARTGEIVDGEIIFDRREG